MQLLPAARGGLYAIFLDFDGVLQTPALSDWLEMEFCDELERYLTQYECVQLVITSTHREGRTLQGVQGLLPAGLRARVVGMTPVTAHGRANGGRQAEIGAWLRENPHVRTWVSVDDEPRLYDSECPWLVVTNPYVGWDAETTELVHRKLQAESISCCHGALDLC